jgi:predicted nucleic acid-binding protein
MRSSPIGTPVARDQAPDLGSHRPTPRSLTHPMIVIDGSALVVAVTDTTERGRAIRTRLVDGSVAPHLVDAEVGQAVRGLVLRDLLSPVDAERSLRAAESLVGDRYPHRPLRPRAWALRDNVSFYDGMYVALAELTDLVLVTCDTRLAGAHGPRCTIEVA